MAPFVINLVETVLPHERVLDVGPGWGKYAVLLREYLNVKPDRIDAVEAWPAYVSDHRLPDLYDEVWIGTAGDPTWHAVEAHELRTMGGSITRIAAESGCGAAAAEILPRYDMVLMVDVIEHMTKPAARRFLRQVPQARVVVCTPVEFFHNGPDLPPTEEHVSHWGADDWHNLRRPVEYLGQEHGAWLVRLGPER